MLPHGFKFNPTDEELIQILERKVAGQEMALHFIVEVNVYDHEPQDLDANRGVASSDNESYYYCKKDNDSREVFGRGWWKATSHVKKVQVDERLFGKKRPLTFYRFKDTNRNRNQATKTNWIMHEYSLESRTTEWRLCKIKYKGSSQFSRQEETQTSSFAQTPYIETNSSTMFYNEVGCAPLTVANCTVSTGESEYSEYWNMEQQQQQQPQDSCVGPLQVPELFSGNNTTSSYLLEQQGHDLVFPEPHFPSLWSWQD
ncbi:hypothetical protein K2173_019073 [Erythroxylum novogranatense]|uniref:NAC domain-containing protein n=1 Tax=Erythroxylum novogranatense TaxID=1862640 RepID=A0AAV8SSN9_9ROSI|nr:hypothetical protein K2173_019073 [Erythroxylum novogranatense]